MLQPVRPPFTGGFSTMGNTLGNTGLVTGRMVLVGTNNITLSGSTDASGNLTVSFSGGAGAAGNTGYLSDGANTASLGTIRLSNLNGISFGLNGQTLTGSHNAITSQSTQFLALTLGGNTAGTTTFHATNNASLFFNGGNNITLSGNGSTVTISAANQTVQTQGITGDQLSIGVSTGGNTSGNTGVNSGNRIVFVGSNNITLSQGTGAGSTTITISGPSLQSAGMSTAGNTSGDSGLVTGQFVLAGGNNITLSGSTNGGSETLTISGPNMLSVGFSTQGNTAGNTGLVTQQVLLVGSNNITLSGSTNAGSQTISIIGAAGGGGNFSAGISNLGNTSSQSGITGTRLVLAGAGAVTLTQATDANGGTVSINAPVQTNQTLGLYAVGNTTVNSSTTLDARTLSFNATNAGAVSWGYSNGSILVSAPQTSSLSATGWAQISTNGSTISIGATTTANLYAAGNTTGTSSGTADIRTMSINGRGIISAAASNSGWEVSAPDLMSAYDPFCNAPITNSTLGQSTLYFVPFDVPYPISASRINFFLSITHTYSGAPQNSTAWLAMGYGIYTRMTGTGSDRMSLLSSYSLSYMSGSVSSSTRLSMTNYMGLSNATSHSTTQYGVNNATASNFLINSYAGYRAIELPLNLTLNPGRSWLGFSVQSASQGNSFVLGHSVVQHQFSNNIAYRPFNVSSAASDASFYMMSAGFGIYSAQSGAWPNSIPLTSDSIRGAPVGTFPAFNFSGISTNTNLI